MMKTVISAVQVVGITLSNIKLVHLFMIYFLRCGVGGSIVKCVLTIAKEYDKFDAWN